MYSNFCLFSDATTAVKETDDDVPVLTPPKVWLLSRFLLVTHFSIFTLQAFPASKESPRDPQGTWNSREPATVIALSASEA